MTLVFQLRKTKHGLTVDVNIDDFGISAKEAMVHCFTYIVMTGISAKEAMVHCFRT